MQANAASPRAPWLTYPLTVMLGVGLALVVTIGLFMMIDLKGNLSFAIPFRATKIAAMMLISYAIAISTVLFQTISNNRILSPSIMGFDALYVLIQTTLVFTLGAQQTVTIHPQVRFCLEVGLMVGFASLLYRWLFNRVRRDLHLLLLVGLIFAVLFRSLTSFMQRLIDPNELIILQDMLFASFNSFDRDLLVISAGLIGIASLVLWRIRHTFDVLALGRETAINLGVNYHRTVVIILGVIAVFVSVSTALVGPVTFFGLLVANMAYQIIGTYKHCWIIPCAAGLAMIFLIGGQMIVERVFSFNTSLSIIIEFLGGVLFLVLLVRGAAR